MKKFLLITVCSLFSLSLRTAPINIIYHTLEPIKEEVPEMTKENIKQYIESLPIQHGKILYQQVILETGHLSSRLATDACNIIGMQVVRKRLTTQTGKFNKYGSYSDWRDCIIDYMLWQQSVVKSRMTEDQYYSFLQRVYSTSDHYINVLKQIGYE